MTTWRELLVKLPNMTEDDVKQMLVEEHAGRRRVTIMLRLHQRFCAMRAERERRELLA